MWRENSIQYMGIFSKKGIVAVCDDHYDDDDDDGLEEVCMCVRVCLEETGGWWSEGMCKGLRWLASYCSSHS